MKSTLLKLTILSFLGAFLIGCASTEPVSQQTTASENTTKHPLNRANGNGVASFIH
jgi:type IV pilus biogenesis protein CpaD/CtpE